MNVVRKNSEGRALRERWRNLTTVVLRWEARANVFLGSALKNPCCRKQQAPVRTYRSHTSITHTG